VKFQVKLRRNTLHTVTIEIEAENEEEAHDAALDAAENPDSNFDWELDSEDFDIEDILEA
jgi:hypothetical protein